MKGIQVKVPETQAMPVTGLTRGITMLEKMYKENLKDNKVELDRLDFPELIRFCRELMGLKQYACAEYLGFEEPRYKKIESGRFSEPIESWEMSRLVKFFKLTDSVLQSKQRTFIKQGNKSLMEKGREIWNEDDSTKGARDVRSNRNYRRVCGTLDGAGE